MNRRHLLIAVVIGTAASQASALGEHHDEPANHPEPHAEPGATPTELPYEGVVRKIDHKHIKITLKHGPNVNLGMTAPPSAALPDGISASRTQRRSRFALMPSDNSTDAMETPGCAVDATAWALNSSLCNRRRRRSTGSDRSPRTYLYVPSVRRKIANGFLSCRAGGRRSSGRSW